MVKNKVYVMVFVALLASFAVLIGCAGEGVGDDAKSAGSSMGVTDDGVGDLPPATTAEPIEDGEAENVNLPAKEDEEGSPLFVPPLFPPQKLGTFPGLNVETERQLKLDYADYINITVPDFSRPKYTISDVYIKKYYGNYNGCVVVLMDANGLTYLFVNTFVTVAGMKFGFTSSNVFKAWYQIDGSGSGRFYDVAVLYDAGVLTDVDIRSIYEVYAGEVNNKN